MVPTNCGPSRRHALGPGNSAMALGALALRLITSSDLSVWLLTSGGSGSDISTSIASNTAMAGCCHCLCAVPIPELLLGSVAAFGAVVGVAAAAGGGV